MVGDRFVGAIVKDEALETCECQESVRVDVVSDSLLPSEAEEGVSDANGDFGASCTGMLLGGVVSNDSGAGLEDSLEVNLAMG